MEHVLDQVIRPFLCGSGGDPEVVLAAAVSAFTDPRKRIAELLLRRSTPQNLIERMSEVEQVPPGKLPPDDECALKQGWATYRDLMHELGDQIQNVPNLMWKPSWILQSSAAMDFCFTAVCAFLDGEVQGPVNPGRLSRACATARSTAEELLEAARVNRRISAPGEADRWRSQEMTRLFGAWGDEPGMDEDLQGIYDSRRDIRTS